MTVFIDNAEFTQRLQRENDELLAENIKLRKLLKQIAQDTQNPNTQVTVVIKEKGQEQ